MKNILAWLNPRNAERGITSWWKFHLLVTAPSVVIVTAVVFFLLGFGLGFGSGVKFGRAYFHSHYSQRELRVPPPIGAPLPPIGAPVQHVAYIRNGFAPPVVDQSYTNECESWSFCESWTYLYNARRYDDARKHHRKPPASVQFGCTFLYDLLTRGYDNTSRPSDYPPLLKQWGMPYRRDYPYPPAAEVFPYPGALYGKALPHRYPVHLQVLAGDTLGGGSGLVNRIKAVIARSRLPVVTAIPIFPSSLDAANEHSAHVDLPTPGDTYTGGHAFPLLGYDDHQCYQHVCGWFWAQNSYSTAYGAKGYFWVSYRLIAEWGYATVVVHLNPALTPGGRSVPPPVFVPSHGPAHNIVPPGFKVPPLLGGLPWYVHGVYTHDTGVNITDLINAAGDRHGVWPVGITAVLATESAINQYSDRWGTWPDVSHGIAQFTDQTAEGYGVCVDDSSCRAWMDNLSNSIDLAAGFLASLQKETGVGWPNLYTVYNQGPGYGYQASAYYQPQGQAYSNYEFNFLPNYQYVLATYAGGSPPAPPKPKAFPLKLWLQAHTWNPKRIPEVWPWHKQGRGFVLRVEAAAWIEYGPKKAGPILAAPAWHPQPNGGGFMETRFRNRTFFWWVHHRGWEKWAPA